MKKLRLQFLLALFLPFTLILGGGIWGGFTQHTHRSADQGGVISWIPTGFVGCFAGNSPPANTLESYGQAVSRVTYATLFGIVGTTYGAGDGSTTFNLPDLRGRMMIGMDNMGGSAANRVTAAAADTLGGTGGNEIINRTQIPLSDAIGGTTTYWISTAGFGNVQSVGGQPYNPPFIALKCVIGT